MMRVMILLVNKELPCIKRLIERKVARKKATKNPYLGRTAKTVSFLHESFGWGNDYEYVKMVLFVLLTR